MKIEPVATVDCADTGDYSQEWFAEILPNAHQITTIKVGTKLYTEAQMRQLAEACALITETEWSTDAEHAYGKDIGALLRNMIKEMLG